MAKTKKVQQSAGISIPRIKYVDALRKSTMLNRGRPLLDHDDFDDTLLDQQFSEAYTKALEAGFVEEKTVAVNDRSVLVHQSVAPSIEQIASVAVLLDADIKDLQLDAASIGFDLQALRDYRTEKVQIATALDLAWDKFGYPLLDWVEDEEAAKTEIQFRRSVKSAAAMLTHPNDNYGLKAFLKTETKTDGKTGKTRQVVISPIAPAYLPEAGWEEAVRKSALVLIAIIHPTTTVPSDIESTTKDIEKLRERFAGTSESIAELKAAGELAKAKEAMDKVSAEIDAAETQKAADELLTVKAEIARHIENIKVELAEIRKLQKQLPEVEADELDTMLFKLLSGDDFSATPVTEDDGNLD